MINIIKKQRFLSKQMRTLEHNIHKQVKDALMGDLTPKVAVIESLLRKLNEAKHRLNDKDLQEF
jgi:hypothetical protein